MSAMEASIIIVAIADITMYLKAPSRASLSFCKAININDVTAATSRNTYNENISLTITIPHIPIEAIMSRFIKLNLCSSSLMV